MRTKRLDTDVADEKRKKLNRLAVMIVEMHPQTFSDWLDQQPKKMGFNPGVKDENPLIVFLRGWFHESIRLRGTYGMTLPGLRDSQTLPGWVYDVQKQLVERKRKAGVWETITVKELQYIMKNTLQSYDATSNKVTAIKQIIDHRNKLEVL